MFTKGSSASPAKLAFGVLDTPAEGGSYKGAVPITGWALYENGVDHVAIYIDRNYLADVPVSGKRDDVVKVYPDFASTTDINFAGEFHTEGLTPGAHQMIARVVGKNGTTRDLPPHAFNVAP
jgi:hypothetical protein